MRQLAKGNATDVSGAGTKPRIVSMQVKAKDDLETVPAKNIVTDAEQNTEA